MLVGTGFCEKSALCWYVKDGVENSANTRTSIQEFCPKYFTACHGTLSYSKDGVEATNITIHNTDA